MSNLSTIDAMASFWRFFQYCALLVILNLGNPLAAHAELILTAPPRESPEAGNAIYQPLAQYLSDLLGVAVIYRHPLNWKEYETKMKNDEFDIVFDGPHFAAWRLEKLSAQPLVKLPGALQFVLIAHENDVKVHRLDDLVGESICTLPSPNLGALTLFSMFPNPVRQPKYQMVGGGFKEAVATFKDRQCRGAIVRRSFYENPQNADLMAGTKVIRISKPLTNQGVTASSRLPPDHRQKIIDSLTKREGAVAAKAILDRFHGDAAAFIPSKQTDYREHNLLTDNIIFGW